MTSMMQEPLLDYWIKYGASSTGELNRMAYGVSANFNLG